MIGSFEMLSAAEDLAAMLYSDSLVPVDESFDRIRLAVIADGVVPTLYEKECLVYGGPLHAVIDDDHPETEGEGNPEVDRRFSHTSAVIKSFF